GNEVALDQLAERLQVAERRRPYAEAVRVGRLPVADDEVAELAFRRFDRVIGLAGGGLDQARNLSDDRSLGNAFRRLTDDAERLPELLESHEVPIVRVAVGADRHVELHLVVRGVRLVLADVLRNARPAQRRTAQTDGNRFRSRNDADALRPLEPDAIVRQELFVLGDLRVHQIAELEDLLRPPRRHVQRPAPPPPPLLRPPPTPH